MDPRRIKAIYADTGHWLARCDHDTGVIELNKRDFPRLSPLMQDYVWCHEYAHLLYDTFDESAVNAIVDKIFVDRGRTKAERKVRLNFLQKSEGSAYSSSFDPTTAVSWRIDKVFGIVRDIITTKIYNDAVFDANENSGFNSLNEEKQKIVVDTFLKSSFNLARRSSTRTAQNFFMGKMEPLLTPISISSYALLVSRYRWIADYVDKYEKKYGFGFIEVTPADYTDVYIGIAVIVAILAVAGYLIYRYKIKKS